MERFAETTTVETTWIEGAITTASRWLRLIFAISALLMLSYAVSMFVLEMDLYYAVLAAIAVAVAILLSRKFELGLVIFCLIAPFDDFDSPAVLGAEASYQAGIMPSEAGLVLLCLFWIGSQVLGSDIRLIRTRLDIPILTFFGVAVASVAASYFIWDSEVNRYDNPILFQVAEIGIWVLCVAAYFLPANSFKSRAWIAAVYWPIAAVGLYVSFHQFSGLEMPWSIAHSTFMISFAATLTAAKLLFGRTTGSAKLGYLVLLCVYLFAAMWNRGWVSGWFAAWLGVAAVTLVYSRRMFVVFALIALVVLFIFPGVYNSVYDESRQEGDLDRIGLWGDAVGMAARTNPLLGIGPGDYLAYARRYGTIWYGDRTYTTAHSNYAQLIAELGLLGIAAFLWIVVAGIKTGAETIRKSRSDLKWLAVGATAVFASMAVTSLVGDYLFPSRVNGGIWTFGTSLFPWFLLGTAVASTRLDERKFEG
ncbi:MAG: O-antigen ligase family protein [Armatimonadetes bacterium]|nr:O-antigen ligase family protein [Armatimonadota bacterium]